MARRDVVIVGSFNQDLVFAVDSFPAQGQTVLGRQQSGPGGKGANQAVAARRAGARTRFLCALGLDAFASTARAFMKEEKVELLAAIKPTVPTGSAGIFVDRSGQNMIVVALGANEHLQPEDLPDSLFTPTSVTVFQLETPPAAVAHGLAIARSAGATTILNPAPWRYDLPEDLWRNVDIAVPNETEFIAMLRARGVAVRSPATAAPADLHRHCRVLGVPTVIVTLGAAGCFVSTSDSHRRIPAHAGVRVVDTVGAGDAFVGALAAGLCRDSGLPAAVDYAMATAALSVTKAGAAPAMPHEREIEAFLLERTVKVI